MKKYLGKAILLFVVMATGCDIIETDSEATEVRHIKMLTAPNKAAMIDLQKVFPSYSDTRISGNDGKLTYFGDRYIKYKSASVDGDAFSFGVRTGSKETKVNVALATQADGEECSDTEAFTYATVANDEVLVVNLLNNPEFCGYDIYSPTEIGIAGSREGIDVDDNSDGVLIALCSCLEEGNSAILTYVPPAGFVGRVKFKYYLHAISDVQQYGEVVYYDPQYSEYFSAHDVIIDVTAGAH